MIGWTFSLRRLENRMSPLKEESREGGEQPETLRSRRASSSAAAIERSLGLRISSSDRHGKNARSNLQGASGTEASSGVGKRNCSAAARMEFAVQRYRSSCSSASSESSEECK